MDDKDKALESANRARAVALLCSHGSDHFGSLVMTASQVFALSEKLADLRGLGVHQESIRPEQWDSHVGELLSWDEVSPHSLLAGYLMAKADDVFPGRNHWWLCEY